MRRRRIVRSLVSGGVVIAIFVGALPAFADYKDVAATIADIPLPWVAVLLVAAVASIAPHWWVLVASMPGLRFPEAGAANLASSAAANTLPGGGAVGVGVSYGMYASWGFSPLEITRGVVVSGVWENAVQLGLPIAALMLLVVSGDASVTLVAWAATGTVFFLVVSIGFTAVLHIDRLARWFGRFLQTSASWLRRLVRKPPVTGWDEELSRLRRRSLVVIRRRWVQLTISAVVSHLAMFGVLLLTLRLVGVSSREVGWVMVFGTFAFVRLLQVLPITPGGVGLVEVGYAALLTQGLGPTASAEAVAAVLVFRFLTFVLPILLGLAAWIAWRSGWAWPAPPHPRPELAPAPATVTAGTARGDAQPTRSIV